MWTIINGISVIDTIIENLQSRVNLQPTVGVVLGSGLDKLSSSIEFPKSMVSFFVIEKAVAVGISFTDTTMIEIVATSDIHTPSVTLNVKLSGPSVKVLELSSGV